MAGYKYVYYYYYCNGAGRDDYRIKAELLQKELSELQEKVSCTIVCCLRNETVSKCKHVHVKHSTLCLKNEPCNFFKQEPEILPNINDLCYKELPQYPD